MHGPIRAGYPVLAPDGSVTAPQFSFAADSDTGFYRSGSGVIEVAVNGVRRLQFSGAAGAGLLVRSSNDGATVLNVNDFNASVTLPVLISNGTAPAPAIAFSNSSGTGFYRQAADAIGVVTNQAERLRVDTDTTASQTALLVSVAGAAVQRVSVGAADSGGSGFRVLRVSN